MSDNELSKIVRFIDYYNTIDLTICTCGQQFSDAKVDGPYEPEFNILQYVTDGKGFLELNGKTYEVNKGDMFFLPEGKTCKYYGDKKNPYSYYWVSFQGKFAEHLLKRCNITPDNPVLHLDDKKCEHLFKKMFEDMKKNKFVSIIKVMSHLYNLFSVLLVKTNDSSGSQVDYIVERAVAYIESHFKEPITISDVFNQLHCDRSWFVRRFKQQLNITPTEYLTKLRLTHAKKLLKDSNDTIKQISESCGMDYKTFWSWFRRQTGRNPVNYREEKRKNKQHEEITKKQTND